MGKTMVQSGQALGKDGKKVKRKATSSTARGEGGSWGKTKEGLGEEGTLQNGEV